ncbi:MAG: helix-turn-helix transcriptional regulator [Rhizobacter sp.]|nr:helix-turn-helix transcriptional regulator [Ferruginibacter sp.]
MKLSKQIRILRGVTAVRVKMQMTQLAFAHYLGISKSLVSMVENGRRSLPAAALVKITQLEMAFDTARKGHAIMMPATIAINETADQQYIREGREAINRLDLARLQYRLKRMAEKYASSTNALQYLEWAMKLRAPSQESGGLELAKQQLMIKLRRCIEPAQAKLKGKIAMLEIILRAGKQPPQLETKLVQVQQRVWPLGQTG